MPSVETKGWGRSRRVSSVPLRKPQKVLTAMPDTMRTTGLVTPKFCTSTPMRQVDSTVLEPTDRSMPAVMRTTSMPAEMRQLMDVCLRMFIWLPKRRNLSGMVMEKMMNSRRS